MTEFKAANKTKYDNGGSGDNVISDGYIKTVEKIWMDSFTFSAVLSTADTVAIATIPKNKKITGVEVYLPASIAPTNATITVGTAGDADKFIDSAPCSLLQTSAARELVKKITMDSNFQFVTTAQTDIFLAFDTLAITAPTAGTITTIVRYT